MTGTEFQMSYELLIIELGLSDQPFLLDYDKYHERAAPTLLTQVWSRMNKFGFRLTTGTAKFHPPRDGDRWLMSAIEELGYTKEECRIINLVRLHQQVLFQSDVFEADGQRLDILAQGDSDNILKETPKQATLQEVPTSENWTLIT